MPVALRYAARSDLGLGSKTRNEDSGYAGPDLLILADGMGGHAAGDTASSTVVAQLIHLAGEGYAADEALQQLTASIEEANGQLRAEMDAAPDLEGMGTTLIAVLLTGNKLAVANIGDSRAYLLRDGVFSQITKDHSFVQTLLDEGRITPEEATNHPQRSLVTRVLTGRPDDEPDVSMREAKVGDRYLLCSDGLSDYVKAETIEQIVRGEGTSGEIADRLIAIARKSAARDNVTVVIADVVSSSVPTSTTPQIVGAAAAREVGIPTQEPQSPAEKAAALSRQVSGDEPENPDLPPVLAEEGPSRFKLLRRLGLAALVLAILGVGSYLAYTWTQRQFYVGTDHGIVTIYRGVADDLGPIKLHKADIKTDIAVTDLPSAYQTRVTAGISAEDRSDAIRVVEELRTQMVLCQQAAAAGNSCG